MEIKDFQSWYDKRINGMKGGSILEEVKWKNTAEQGWNACKKEILKILHSPKTPLYISDDEMADAYVDKDFLIEKIGKL